MLYYFKCQKCLNTSGIFLESELPGDMPTCNHCTKEGGSSKVDKLSTMAFFFGCSDCKGQWMYSAPSTYSDEKANRPDCPTCGHNHSIFFVPLTTDANKAQKRKKAGLLNPARHDVSGSLDIAPDAAVLNLKRRRLDDGFQDEVPTFSVKPVEDDDAKARIDTERAYQKVKRRRQDYDTKFGALSNAQNPKTTTTHPGRVVSLNQYKTLLTHRETVNSTSYPRLSQSAPTVVNAAKIVGRDAVWDYRELGPNSFMRRLCTLLYTIDFGGDSMNPVELQAMWAHGSLFISSNNYSYGLELENSLGTHGTLKALIGQIKIGKTGAGSINSSKRNLKKSHTDRLPDYKAAFVSNTEAAYSEYFQYQWKYIFKQLRASLSCANHELLTITKNGDDYTAWTAPAVAPGRVYLVVPEQGRGTFTKKDIHAEQMFYPILMNLDAAGLLSESSPAFIGGVKTPCRTCYEVLQAASGALGTKLVLPTDASGHYWEASGMHVPSTVFPPAHQTMVFGKPGSDKIFDTEVPPSPTGH
ncbi:hypothetical protein HJC22_24205 [Corallococcus exiguus]|uniref:hypothetical protein n=1 Tax=Corallococcus TaxID=83461 RepID=UPI000ED01AFD|nr:MULTISPECIES: hypothetical protein [Corallococcus]NNC18821.1 hypothetical protein [Corallococcus exiguus]RKI18747.1 hypothetical protein D7Y15_07215 [Corallococcus sp. AB030]RUO91015.1 hypothetical protein D7Y11_22255 [Corallococcus sp. AB018]